MLVVRPAVATPEELAAALRESFGDRKIQRGKVKLELPRLAESGNVIDVKRVIVAIDSGHIVHPDAVKAQMEGGVIWGLSSVMHEEITIENGRVVQSNFADYPVLRLAETPPKIETIIMPTGGFWGGVGEPPIGGVIPALCNALFAATGKRVRSMPLKNHGFSYKT